VIIEMRFDEASAAYLFDLSTSDCDFERGFGELFKWDYAGVFGLRLCDRRIGTKTDLDS